MNIYLVVAILSLLVGVALFVRQYHFKYIRPSRACLITYLLDGLRRKFRPAIKPILSIKPVL